MDEFPAQTVDPLYCYLGMGTTSFVLLSIIACIICGVIWKALFERKAFMWVLVGVFLANLIRLIWWVLLKQSFMRFNADSIKTFGQFIRIPDVIVLNILFLVLVLFLFMWVDGVHSLLYPNLKRFSLKLKIAFGVFSLIVTAYCVAVIIGYIATASTNYQFGLHAPTLNAPVNDLSIFQR